MRHDKLKIGQMLHFESEELPYKLICISERYAIVTRPLDREADEHLLQYQVEMSAYFNIEEAYEHLKDEVVYSLLDFAEGRRAPSNLIFSPYDYSKEKDCKLSLMDLELGHHELSRRHGRDLDINWLRTFGKIV